MIVKMYGECFNYINAQSTCANSETFGSISCNDSLNCTLYNQSIPFIITGVSLMVLGIIIACMTMFLKI